ncbi:hypothetical protein F4777DRAFT_590266 [Nemania sp. FL0916]|nr:hypothetical protein F4777DRAFT_590266 [Nemania sp. FL0916]
MDMPLSSKAAASGGRQQSFTPSVKEFAPRTVEAKNRIITSSFITQTIPSAHRYAGVIGICNVPGDKAGMNDLGWHVADFLAFRALLCGTNPPKAQAWLAMCDIPALVEANPSCYTHGKDRRLVGPAAVPEPRQGPGRLTREDNIQVEASAKGLREKFIQAVTNKLHIAKNNNYPLLIIVCGPTSIEQDIYFGKVDSNHQYALKDLRHDLGYSINHVDAVVVTPSLFSAGWQVNTSFGRPTCTEVCGNETEFLAGQCGGLFAQDIVRSFIGWECPVLDGNKVDPKIKGSERFPGPVRPPGAVETLLARLQITIQSYLMGGLSSSPTNHSFSFDKRNDEWEALIGRRGKLPDYQTLEDYELKWSALPATRTLESPEAGFPFLGNAFGGTRLSQTNHIRYLIEESYVAWPDYWVSSFGQETRREFERFIRVVQPDDSQCHEIFNILEHRARMSILADAIRCRDWNCSKWKQNLTNADRSSLIRDFGTVIDIVPGPNMPPGINRNSLSRLQTRLESGASYLRAALGIRLSTMGTPSEVSASHINTCK